MSVAVGVRQQQLQQRGGLHHMNGEKKQNKAVVKDIGQIGGKYIKAKGPSHGWRQRRLDDRIYIFKEIIFGPSHSHRWEIPHGLDDILM